MLKSCPTLKLWESKINNLTSLIVQQQIDMQNGVMVNGSTSRPRTPSLNALSLTEYAANPSPPNGNSGVKIRALVPEEFLLPNGYPDV